MVAALHSCLGEFPLRAAVACVVLALRITGDIAFVPESQCHKHRSP